MKRFISVLFVFTLIQTACAGADKPIRVDELPAKARQFIVDHFKSENISFAKMDTEIADKNYEVVFDSGSKIEFDKKGEWKEVKCKNANIPANIVPEQIEKYVSNKFSGHGIREISRDRRDYEVKLSNGLELKFDKKFNLIDMDD